MMPDDVVGSDGLFLRGSCISVRFDLGLDGERGRTSPAAKLECLYGRLLSVIHKFSKPLQKLGIHDTHLLNPHLLVAYRRRSIVQ